MSSPHQRQLYLNLSVKDVARSVAFWKGLGFEFDPKFTDDKAACLIIGKDIMVMLLAEPFFRGFTRREVCDRASHTEAISAVSCESRAAVDAMVRQAIETGGQAAMEPQDHGFMYVWSFYDPDGHHWEPMWMDASAEPGAA